MSTKWAEIADPHMPARQFARTVLRARMQVVESLLSRAAQDCGEEIELVHQLRVACRRAAAALRAFAPLMTKQPKQLKKWLRKIRDAAGPARDIDVLLARFENARADAVRSYAVQRLSGDRRSVQKPLGKVARRAKNGKLANAVDGVLKGLKGAPTKKPRLGKYGRSAVRLAYLPFAQHALIGNPTTAELHQLRIAGKHLRYSLEIFHGLDSARVDPLYALVEELQTRLGEINDHATAQALYQRWLADIPAESLAADLAAKLIQEHASVVQLRERFLHWWDIERVAKVHKLVTEFCE